MKKKKRTEIIIYFITFLLHFSILFAISFFVKERINASSYFQDIELINVPEFRMQRQTRPKSIEEGTKEETDDKAKTELVSGGDDSNYSGQFMAATAPIFPLNYIKSRVVYPPLARQQGIQNIQVILELLIDKNGEIKKVNVLKDPGYGN